MYLLHVFGAAGARMALELLGIGADPLLFTAGLAAGIGLPVILQPLFPRYAIVSRLVLGQAPIRRGSADAGVRGLPVAVQRA